jgi:hypothetical protein
MTRELLFCSPVASSEILVFLAIDLYAEAHLSATFSQGKSDPGMVCTTCVPMVFDVSLQADNLLLSRKKFMW